jgi:N-acetylglucosamine transport system substrate-binding protein
MGSTHTENNGSEHDGTTAGVGRRGLIKRSAALGLISVPTMSFLASCASGGDEQEGVKDGKKTA